MVSDTPGYFDTNAHYKNKVCNTFINFYSQIKNCTSNAYKKMKL
jgi:hypothetical protein